MIKWGIQQQIHALAIVIVVTAASYAVYSNQLSAGFLLHKQLNSLARLPSGLFTDTRWHRKYEIRLIEYNWKNGDDSLIQLQSTIKKMVTQKDSANAICLLPNDEYDYKLLIRISNICETEHVAAFGKIDGNFYIIPYASRRAQRVSGKCFWL